MCLFSFYRWESSRLLLRKPTLRWTWACRLFRRESSWDQHQWEEEEEEEEAGGAKGDFEL